MKNCILALDAGGTFLKAVFFDLSANLIENSLMQQAVDSDGELKLVKDAYFALLGRLKEFAVKNKLNVIGISVDTPGPFDYKTGTSLMKHKYLALYGISLIPWFNEFFPKTEISFIHDSTAFAYGCISAQDKNAACAMLGTGLGFAVIKDGEILLNEMGSSFYSLYKTPLKDGIAEDFVSARGVVRLYHDLGGDAENAKQVAQRAFEGEELATKAFKQLGELLAKVVIPTFNEVNTEVFYVGGQVSKSIALFINELTLGLKDTSVKKISVPDNLDLIHLLGAVKYFIKKKA